MLDNPREEAELDIAGKDDKTFKIFLSQYGAPAFMRRAQKVAAAFEDCQTRCRKQRDDWLTMVRIRLGMLRRMTRDELPRCTSESTRHAMARLVELVEPASCPSITPTDSPRAIASALRDLSDSVHIFNERWRRFIETFDLNDLNLQRLNYNRYYVLEKECLTRSPRLARQGFTPLSPLTTADLFEVFPLLPTFEV